MAKNYNMDAISDLHEALNLRNINMDRIKKNLDNIENWSDDEGFTDAIGAYSEQIYIDNRIIRDFVSGIYGIAYLQDTFDEIRGNNDISFDNYIRRAIRRQREDYIWDTVNNIVLPE